MKKVLYLNKVVDKMIPATERERSHTSSLDRIMRRCSSLLEASQKGFNGLVGMDMVIGGQFNTFSEQMVTQAADFLWYVEKDLNAVERGDNPFRPGLESCNQRIIAEVVFGVVDPLKDHALLEENRRTLVVGTELVNSLRGGSLSVQDTAPVLRFIAEKSAAYERIANEATEQILRSRIQK